MRNIKIGRAVWWLCGLWLTGILFPGFCQAQTVTDSIAKDVRSFAARNITRARTLNLYWETKGSHDYTLKMNGSTLERGRVHDLHAIKFSAVFPFFARKRFSVYANLQYGCYKSVHDVAGAERSILFAEDAYHYYAGGISGSYYADIFGKPVVFSANMTLDGWHGGVGMVSGRLSALMIIMRRTDMGLSAGLMGMTLFNSVPVFPIVTLWYRFNPALSMDLTLPSQAFLRWQMQVHRFSIGTMMWGEGFYIPLNFEGMSETCYCSEAVFKPLLQYECITNRHLYLSVSAGMSIVMKNGLYKKNRRKMAFIDMDGNVEKKPVMELERKVTPFFNLGISYSLFK